jgi:hypothetical protein
MSSGETAKPPATFEERNPFDISKRSEKEVAAEIAQRLAAWKQARGRSYATQSSTVPQSSTVASAEGKPIGAPVQPARLPKFGEYARARPINEPQSHAIPANAKSVNPSSAVGPTSRAPAHATPAKPALAKPAERPLPLAVFAAVQRAMPPAPSLKRPAAPPEPTIRAPAFEAAETATLQNASQLEMPAAELPQIEETTAVEPPNAQPSQIDVAEPIASDHIDAPVAETREIEIAPPVSAAPVNEMVQASDSVVERFERRELDEHRDTSETPASEADLSAIAAVDATQADVQTDPIAAAALESVIDSARQIEPPTTETRDIEAPWIQPPATELPEADEPVPAAQESEPARSTPLAAEAADIEPQTTDPHDIDAPAMREAEFMPPAPVEPRRFDLRAIRMLDTEAPAPILRRPEIVAPSAPAVEADDIEVHRIGTGEIEAGEIGTGDGAPGIEEPRLEAPQSEIPAPEAPRIIVRRPIFPHIEPAEWEVRPSSASARARRQPRGGTGWAIGLGSLLLIAGVTAPAAIWQQGRTVAPPSLDQAVALNPVPTPAPQTTPQNAQPAINAEPANPQHAAPQPAAPQPAAPQPAAPQPASPPTDQAQNQPAPQPQPAAAANTADAPQPAPQQQVSQQASLGTVANGGEVADAPISVPPPPQAIQPELAPPAASDASAAPPATDDTPLYPPTPRPFQPEFAATPFHPTTMDGMASVATKPTVTGRLKPTQSASIAVPNAAPSAPQRLVAKPAKPVTKKRQPTLDQMFNDLIQSLSGGQPVNPANKPASPSQRR